MSRNDRGADHVGLLISYTWEGSKFKKEDFIFQSKCHLRIEEYVNLCRTSDDIKIVELMKKYAG